MRTEAEVRNDVARRLGYVPVHLRTGDQPADVLATLWEHGLAAHWDSAVPAIFREELLVQLSLSCAVPACAVAHCCELSLGGASPSEIWSLVDAVRHSAPIEPAELLAELRGMGALGAWPDQGSAPYELLQKSCRAAYESARAAEALRSALFAVLGEAWTGPVMRFLLYVRHYHGALVMFPGAPWLEDARIAGAMASFRTDEPRLHRLLARLACPPRGRSSPARGSRASAVDTPVEHARAGREPPPAVATAREAAKVQLRNAFECSAIGMALVGLEGRFLRVNPALTRIVGYSKEELLGKNFQDITHPDHLPADEALRERLLAGGAETYHLEKRYRHRRGHLVWILLSVSLVRSRAGEPLHFVAQIQDITQRKEAERRLSASEARYRALSLQAPVGIFETDPDGACRFVNHTWEEMTGTSSEDALGRAWVTWVCEADRERVLEAFRVAEDRSGELALEFRVTSPAGLTWVWGRALALRNESGDVTGFLGTLMDISARKHSEAGLRNTLREKDAMLKEIHHRVKNNLQVISSLLYFQSKDLSDSPARALFQASHGRVRSMALIHEKLYQSSNFSEIDFADYARGLASELQRASGVGSEATEVTSQLESMRMDLDLAIPCGLILNELLAKALSSACAPRRGGAVRVELRKVGAGEAMLAVSASGPRTAADADGSGSLSIELVKMFTSQIDGRFEVESDGAQFRVVFALPEQRANGGETT